MPSPAHQAIHSPEPATDLSARPPTTRSTTGHLDPVDPRPPPHPWGAPLPPGHPDYRPPRGLDISAAGRWVLYVIALGLAAAVIAIAGIAATTHPSAQDPVPPAAIDAGNETGP